jgi:sulfur-carrier protein
MVVTVKLYAGLARRAAITSPEAVAGTPIEIELPKDATVADLIAKLELPKEEIKVTFVNGRACPRDRELDPGDEVGIFPPVGGG